jgi:acyl dehydratase
MSASTHPTTDDTLPQWRVIARNDAIDSNNPMHDDATARQLGFAGGLVPGVTLYGYLTRPLVARLGQAFLEHGRFEVRFRRPVYEGEEVTATARAATAEGSGHDASAEFELTLCNPAGEICVQGRAWVPDSPAPIIPVPSVHPMPTPKVPATPAALGADPRLGTLRECLSTEEGRVFAAGLGDDLALYRTIAHPSWLLRQANLVVDYNIAVGPWIHVASDIEHCGVVGLGEPVSIHGRVLTLYERKGNDWLDLEVVYVTSRPVMRVRHSLIYRLAGPT